MHTRIINYSFLSILITLIFFFCSWSSVRNAARKLQFILVSKIFSWAPNFRDFYIIVRKYSQDCPFENKFKLSSIIMTLRFLVLSYLQVLINLARSSIRKKIKLNNTFYLRKKRLKFLFNYLFLFFILSSWYFSYLARTKVFNLCKQFNFSMFI